MIKIKKKEMDFLSSEVNYWLENKIISENQSEEIFSLYEIKSRSLKLILLIAGGILTGLGFVSFIAAHWSEIPKVIRVCMIFGAYIATVGIYYYFGASGSKTGRAFLMLGSLIFGSGIFLISRMYDYRITDISGIGWWIIGMLIISFFSKDSWQLYLLEFLSLLYLTGTNAIDIFALQFMTYSRLPITSFFLPIKAFALIFALISICFYVKDRIAFNISMILFLMLSASRMTLCFGGTWTLIILVISGGLISFTNFWQDAASFGLLMSGMFGLLLTWPEFWRGEFFASRSSFFSILTALLLAPLMIFQIYKGKILTGGLFFVLLASRYFFDRIFGFMPKAWGFTITGVIFLIAGFFLERRKSQE